MIISKLGIAPSALKGEVVIVTGAGGGIGFEAARSLLWLGANVVIAEIDLKRGSRAAEVLESEFGKGRVIFVPTDVGDEASVANLFEKAISAFGKADAIINNATITEIGLVKDLSIEEWDKSYRVNLRGPVLMAKTFLPSMIARNHGAFVCVSSTGTAYLGCYETFKTAQVHLADTLDAELEGTEVAAYAIGPGLVPTDTAMDAVRRLAPQMGLSVDDFFEMNRGAMLSVEEAGAGFAASVVFAGKFRGQEISAIQALKAADIGFGSEKTGIDPEKIAYGSRDRAIALCEAVRATLDEQSEGWKTRSLFERQWVLRDFKKTTGMPVEEWLAALDRLKNDLKSGNPAPRPPLEKLAMYYGHLAELARGFEKDPKKLEENLRHLNAWRDEAESLSEHIR